MEAEIAQIEPSYDDLAFEPSMPRCDIEHYKNNMLAIEKSYSILTSRFSAVLLKLEIARLALEHLKDNAVARDALEEMEKIDARQI